MGQKSNIIQKGIRVLRFRINSNLTTDINWSRKTNDSRVNNSCGKTGNGDPQLEITKV